MDSANPAGVLREDMFALVEKYLNGSQTQTDFCRDYNLSLSKFAYWLKKYRESQKAPGFIPLKFKQPSIMGDTRIELPNGIAIIFNGSINTAFIAELIHRAIE